MTEQLCIPLSRIAALSPDERLREAYARCGRLRERMSFDRAAGEPVVRHCLELVAAALQRAEERGQTGAGRRRRQR